MKAPCPSDSAEFPVIRPLIGEFLREASILCFIKGSAGLLLPAVHRWCVGDAVLALVLQLIYYMFIIYFHHYHYY